MESKMVGREKKKKKTSSSIERALMPGTALTAVPSTSSAPAAGSLQVQSAKNLKDGPSVARILGVPAQKPDEFSDPESSLFDYQQMEEAGYSTVGFGTWPNQGRRQRSSVPSHSQFRSPGHVGVYAEVGDIEGFADGDSPRITGNISDLYATPNKRKSKGKSSSRSGTGSQDDVTSMNRTQQDVQAAMREVQNMPPALDETMSKTVRQNVHVSYTYPGSSRQTDSGRGSTRPDSPIEDEDIQVLRDLANSPELVQLSDQSAQMRHNRAVRGAVAALDVPPGEIVDEGFGGGGFRDSQSMLDAEVVEGLIQASRVSTKGLHAQQTPGRSARSRTPRSGRSLGVADLDVQQLQMEREEMQSELQHLRKVAQAISDGDVEGAQTLYVRKQLEDTREENETLKTTVHRLNVELSDYQAKYRPVDPSELKQAKQLKGLPSKGPIPSWLISKRYLAPLFLAYDDHLEEKDKMIEDCKVELASIKNRTENILKENQRLRRMGGAGLDGQGDTTEWQQLQEQARLVLEENQVLMEQLEVQTNKSKDMYSAHIAEISRMAKKLALSEGEKADTERELEELRFRFREVKHKYDQVVLESGSQVNVHAHINTIADLKRSVTEEKEQVDKELETLRARVKASEEERKNQALQMIELTAENKKLKAELKAMQKSVKQAQQKMAVLHRAIQLSEDKEMVTQEQLANVIKVAEKTALERDTVYKVAREQQHENKVTVSRMMTGSVEVGKLEEKLKLYRMKASAKLSTVADRLKEQDEAFNSQKKEYERELQYLRLLLKEKEEIINSLEKDKKEIEQDLDTMWQAANSENGRVKNLLRCGTRKLREYAHITDALKEEMEEEELLHFSEDENKH